MFETALVSKTGKYIPVEVNTRVIDLEGKAVYLSIVRDITKRLEKEKEIRRLASIPQFNPNPILEIDASGQVIYFNEAAADILQKLGVMEGPSSFLPDWEKVMEEIARNQDRQLYREVKIKDAVFAELIHFIPELNVIRLYAADITARMRGEEAYDRAALETALPAAYVASQPAPVVPQTFYPPPYQAAADTYGTIFGNSLTFTPVGATTPKTQNALQKAIIEMFDEYGRMNATLGTEITDWTAVPAASTGYGFPYVDPPNDKFSPGEAQIWKITHNGVDTHAIHFHLVNVQLINRLGWDGVLKPPDANERGWKETIKMNPLEIIWVAMKADLPTVPFAVPASVAR